MSDVVADIAAVVGGPAARALVCVYGGGSLYVPRRPVPESSLVALLGPLQADRLAERYGGTELHLPLPPVSKARAAFVRELQAADYTAKEIAARTGLHERSVWRILANAPSDARKRVQ